MAVERVIRPGESAAGDRGYVDWGAILAGAAIAAGTSVVLTGFAAALGLGSISADEGGGISGFGLILTAIVAAVSMAAAYMLGGYIAGRMRRRVEGASRDEVTARDGIHGLVVWALGMIVGAFLAAGAVTGAAKAVGSAASTAVEAAGSAVGGVAQGAGQLVGGAVQGAGALAGGAAKGVAQAAPQLADMLPEGMQSNPLDYVTDSLLRPATPGQGYSDAALRREVASIVMNVVRTGEVSGADRAYLQQAIAARTGMTEQEVNARVDDAIARANQLRAEAQEKLQQAQQAVEDAKAQAQQALDQAEAEARDAAETVRVTGILTAFLLAATALLAAAAAYVGAVKGGRHRDEGRIWGWLGYHR